MELQPSTESDYILLVQAAQILISSCYVDVLVAVSIQSAAVPSKAAAVKL